ncbi:MAG: 50S ribosomal protein L4 [Anaerolineaceae bacterium]|nr:50S ribosomal protein L4 [Anaerolineaceae bacterium]
MMLVDVVNMKGEKVSTLELPASVFEAPIFVDLMHQAYVRQMANARLGTHDTKTRAEVSGGGRKPWRQKGTGRARQGSIRSPQWKGGGRVHTPHPHKYTQAMPRKMRQAALRSALSVKAAESKLVIIDKLELAESKTRLMVKALDALVGQTSALILIPAKELHEGVIRSTNNIPDAKILLAGYLNIRDIMSYDKLVMPVATVETIAAHLGEG